MAARKKDIALGLMSGTSADGITACAARFGRGTVEVLRCRTFPYSAGLRRRVLGAAALKAPELSRLHAELGEAFAKAALSVSRGLKPAVIGSHGQTVHHGPEEAPPNTLQLGCPSTIAERARLPVVADFRPRDIAAGGQGAPLVPAFDAFLFSRGPLRAAINIGGIANASLVGGGRLWSAFDTGPGNALLDLAVGLATEGRARLDRGGRLAALGRPDSRAVERALRLPFFRRPPPKSVDRGEFGEAFLLGRFGPVRASRLPDLLATLCLFTARSIALSVRRFAPKGLSLREAVVSGGGTLNPVLMRFLRAELSPCPLVPSDERGLPAMAKEAAAFAWLGLQALKGKPNNCPAATGSRGPRVLGVVVPA